MEEMSRNGAKVLETKAVKMGRKYRVPIYIGESLGQENGTYIVD